MRSALALLRVALGAIFLYAAATKLPDMGAFAEAVANYRMMPAALVPAAAAAVIGIEIAVGLLLVSGRLARAAALVSTALLAAFTIGIAQALARGIDLRCGCFGSSERATWWTVARDAGLLAMALALLVRGPGRLLPRRGATGGPARSVPAARGSHSA
jgi:putative oxidoreductase